MSDDPEAVLAYGYDLGSSEGTWHVREVDEDGCLKLDWTDDDESFTEGIERRLLEYVGFTETDYKVDGYFDRKKAAEAAAGVELDRSGTWDYPGHLLIAKGSDSRCEWSDSMRLDLADMQAKPTAEWDSKLAAACKALGITPTQEGGPGWLVFPFYG